MSNLLLYSTPNAFDFSAIFGNFSEEWYKYLILFFVIAVVISFGIVFRKNEKRNSLSKTQKIVYVGVLSALSVCCNTFLEIPLGDKKISLTITMGFISGYMLGGELAFVVGFIGDLIGGIIMPQGVYNPFLALSSGLFGFIPGVLFTYFKGNDYVKTVISSVLVFVVCSLFLNTFGLYLIYGLGKKTFFAYMVVRIPAQSINAVGNLIFCLITVPILPRILPKNKFNTKGKIDDIKVVVNEEKREEVKGDK